MKDTINTKVALELTNLSTESLEQLIPFFREFETFSGFSSLRADAFKSDYFNKLDLNEFVSYSKAKLGMSEEKGSVKNYRGFSYRSLIKNYSSLLKELLAKEGLIKELYFEVIRKNKENYIRFIDYLKVGDRDKIITNLQKIYELGITELTLDKYAGLDGTFTIGVVQDARYPDFYGIIGMIASDGKKVWLPRIDETGYQFILKDASYKIIYTKGTTHDKVEMIANNLEFNPSSLPSIEELRNPRVLPDIDFNAIKNKTSAININFGYEMLIEKIKELQEYKDYLLSILKEYGYSESDEYKCIMEQLSFLENFIQKLENDKKKYAESYISSGDITGYELARSTKEKKDNHIYQRRLKHL